MLVPPDLWLKSIRVALALRQAKLGVTRSIRPQKINALEDRNSVERSWLTGQFPASKYLEAAANQYARCALFLWRQTKSLFEVGARFEGNLRVEQDARARDVTQLTCVELRQRVLGRADVQRYTNREAHGFSIFFHGLCRGINVQACGHQWRAV